MMRTQFSFRLAIAWTRWAVSLCDVRRATADDVPVLATLIGGFAKGHPAEATPGPKRCWRRLFSVASQSLMSFWRRRTRPPLYEWVAVGNPGHACHLPPLHSSVLLRLLEGPHATLSAHTTREEAKLCSDSDVSSGNAWIGVVPTTVLLQWPSNVLRGILLGAWHSKSSGSRFGNATRQFLAPAEDDVQLGDALIGWVVLPAYHDELAVGGDIVTALRNTPAIRAVEENVWSACAEPARS